MQLKALPDWTQKDENVFKVFIEVGDNIDMVSRIRLRIQNVVF